MLYKLTMKRDSSRSINEKHHKKARQKSVKLQRLKLYLSRNKSRDFFLIDTVQRQNSCFIFLQYFLGF